MKKQGARSRLDVRDLVLIALLSAVGGVLSTYVGYLGNLINRLFGVPFGAGQLIAGVHVLWPLLAHALIRRFGSGTLTGVIKGLVEFLSGGTHGVVIVLVSLVEGLFVDLGMMMSSRRSLGLMMLTGAVASASNVFVFQAIYFAGIPWSVMLGMAGLAAVSGAFFGGYLAWDLRGLVEGAGILRTSTAARERTPSGHWIRHSITLLVVLIGLAGAAAYFVQVVDPSSSPDTVWIEGSVDAPYYYRLSEWRGEHVTITAELRGSTTTIPARAYSGPLLRDVLGAADPRPGVSEVRVIAADGYEIVLQWGDVLGDDRLLLSPEGDSIRLVAADYDGAYWVQKVRRLVLQ